MRHLRSAWLTIALALLPITSHAEAIVGGLVLTNFVNSSTGIPGGSGAFTAFSTGDSAHPADPCISAGNVALFLAALRRCPSRRCAHAAALDSLPADLAKEPQ